MSGKNRQFYEFGNFRLDAEHPSLWRRDELAPLSPKALELLILLVERRGGIVSREELLETIWKGTFVEEANINYTVSVLRKTLDIEDKGHFIQTLPKRGYRFVADVRRVSDKPVSSESLAHEAPNAQVGWHLIVVILAGLFFLTSFGVWWKATKGEVPLTRRNIKTVAILPFKYLSENEQNKALSLGLTDTLISRLGSLNLFTVRPFDAVEKYTRSEKDAIKFGEELKVDAILEGTFQTADNRFRVNVRLWDVRDGA
ncbi:MAG TPA: winged helix-turn-helix domain-containing protein, partial [Pyrinomonadaceae bacterium]|nr:winged helix-turn-helix domain-containing protein [Pyrinomonadaceae bacterium]